MNGITVSSSPMRGAFSRVQRHLAKYGVSDLIIYPTLLRIEQLLSPSKSSYFFDVYSNTGSDRPLENKLNRNDAFFLTHMGLALQKEDSAAGKYGNYPIFTSPDPNYFSGDDSTNAKEYEALQCICNGKLTVKTKPVDRARNFPTELLMYTPERGYLIAPGAGPQVENELPQYGPTMEAKGFMAVPNMIILDGADDNKVELILGEGDTTLIHGPVDNAGDDVTTRNKVVMRMFGFVVDNGAAKVGKYI